MQITFDPAKRAVTLKERGLDFASAGAVFAGHTFDKVDDRFDYGEERIVTVGLLHERMVVIVWTQRGPARHIISMRKPMSANKHDTDSTWVDPDDAPELDDAWFEGADQHRGGRLVKRGRPASGLPRKQQVNLRLDADVLARWKESGPGWQTRINDLLRKSVGL